MSMGQIVFYCGAGLLALTVILAIIFIIVKPKYKPENAVAAAAIPQKKKKAAPIENNETVLLNRETQLLDDGMTRIQR